MNKSIIAAMLAIALVGCTDPKQAYKSLSGAGYTDIEIIGHSWFSCSGDDAFSTGFVAKGPTGVSVEGAVCSGLLFKNSTIRTN